MPALLPALVLFSLVSSITPGPNNFMLMTSGVNFGFRPTLPHMLGVALGFALMVGLVGLGLSGIFARMPVLLSVLKWVGAAYMVILAVRIARSGPLQSGVAGARPITFLQAAAFQWVNPKAWIMAVTACATYSVPDRYTVSVLLIAAVFGIVCLPCVAVWAGFGSTLRRALSNAPTLRLFNWSMSVLLVASLYPVLVE
jgi:threonine/homoserine/homoserine lactone efflux protein